MIYRFPGARDEYDDREPEVKLTKRQRAARKLRKLSKKSKAASLAVSLSIFLAVVGFLEGFGFAAFHIFGPLTRNGVPESFGTHVMMAPVVTLLFAIPFCLGLFILANLHKFVLWVISEMVESGQKNLNKIAKKLDGKDPWDDEEEKD
jgi:hypothetical protein